MLLPGEGVVTLSLVGLSVEFSASPMVEPDYHETSPALSPSDAIPASLV